MPRTHALNQLPTPSVDDAAPMAPRLRRARATCPYCGVGCVLDVEADESGMLGIYADPEVLPNRGMLCPKGALLFKSDAPERRLTQPMIRTAKDRPLQPVTWDTALRFVADRLTTIRDEHGPDALAFYGSGQLDTEASYLFTKLFKGYLRTNQMDTNSRLCMSSAVAGYVKALGSDGPPTCYDDIELADTFVILGANMTANHPVLFNRVRRRRATDANARIVVIDPRRSKTAQFADLHLPVKPGGDVALLLLAARELLDRGEIDRHYIETATEGFGRFVDQLVDLDLDELHDAAGLSPTQIKALVDLLGGDRRVLSFYCMGANQSTRGVDKNTALINLHLMLGEIGKPGAGPFSLTGQPNAMGGREVGYLSHQLPGYRKVASADDRAWVESFWGVEAGTIQPAPGRSAVPMFRAAADGDLHAMWIACTNPAVSMPNLAVVQEGLRRTELIIVQDCFGDTETAAYADVLLPAATFGEKTGTMTNSERLVTRSHPVQDAPGAAMPDWWIAGAAGRAMGFTGFDFDQAEQVWDEFRRMTSGTQCDMTGITNDRLAEGGVHWPCTSNEDPGTRRRYTDHRYPTPNGRARFCVADYAGPAEQTDITYPLALVTGRVASQWHTRARTANVPELVRQSPEPFVEVHPDDAERFSVVDGGWANVVGKRGRALARVKTTGDVRPGTLFLPFHWGDSFHPQTAANALTSDAFDTISKQPELKYASARLEPAHAPKQGSATR